MEAKNKIKVLLIEDDALIADMYKTRLGEEGFIVVNTAIGSEALKLAHESKPQVILLDVILPELDGFSILRELKSDSDTKNIPVMLLTNLGQDSDMAKGKDLGAVAYLVKANFTPSQIVEEINKVINNK